MAIDKQLRDLTNASFRFVVDVGGETKAAFTECTLPVIEWNLEEIKEGGLNSFIHQLPGQRKGAKVSLKNGIGKNELINWYITSVNGEISRKDVTIKLLDSLQETLMVWQIKDAYPSKWTGPQLKTSENSIAIQTLEFACGEVSVSTD
jgi:phage tail-like protein